MPHLADPLCDICGRPQEGRALYSLGTRRNEEDDIISIRHWDCEQEHGVFAQLRRAAQRIDRGHT